MYGVLCNTQREREGGEGGRQYVRIENKRTRLGIGVDERKKKLILYTDDSVCIPAEANYPSRSVELCTPPESDAGIGSILTS